MISNSRLNDIKNYVYNEFLVDNVNVDFEKCKDVFDCLSELQYRRAKDAKEMQDEYNSPARGER